MYSSKDPGISLLDTCKCYPILFLRLEGWYTEPKLKVEVINGRQTGTNKSQTENSEHFLFNSSSNSSSSGSQRSVPLIFLVYSITYPTMKHLSL